jgi:hypothetical protein
MAAAQKDEETQRAMFAPPRHQGPRPAGAINAIVPVSLTKAAPDSMVKRRRAGTPLAAEGERPWIPSLNGTDIVPIQVAG